jgi:Nucleoside-diphosphate-sugar epimerases
MKIAVTGASGHVGRYVLNELSAHGYEILALNHHLDKNCGFPQKEIDVTDFKQVMESLKGCDAVIHLAAIPNPRGDMDDTVFRNNLMGNYNIVLAAGITGIKRVAIASSDCALGVTYRHNPMNRVVYLPVDEEHPAAPDNGYGMSKILSEKMCDCMSLRFPELSISSLRISHVTDPSDYEKGSRFSEWTSNPDAGPDNLWSYIDVRDCARVFRLAIEKPIIGHQVYYIAAADTRCTAPSVELISRYYPDTRLKAGFTDHESMESTKKAKQMLGFSAEYSWNG